MRVILGIALALAVLLALVDFSNSKPRSKDGPILIKAEALLLDSRDAARNRLGSLDFLGAWRLTSDDPGFGGLSAINVRPDSRLRALNDSGVAYEFPQPGQGAQGVAIRLRPPHRKHDPIHSPTDSESMAADEAHGLLWVGYEFDQLICRYPLDVSGTGRCRAWPQMRDWPTTESLESMARLADGRFLFLAEGADGEKGGRDALLFAGDPVDPATPAPIRMSYSPPTGYNPTDAIMIGDGQLLVLNRRATVYDGFTAILTVVDITHMRAGAVLTGREVARLAPPVLADNFEGLALERRDGRRIVWVVSDDNHLFFQRTLLVKFALPDHF